MWTQENLNRVSEILKCSGEANWPRICVELNVRTGNPNHVVASVKYGNRAVADEYEFRSIPRYDEAKGVVVVENPWSTAHAVFKKTQDPNYPAFGKYIEIDADLATKLLVLGGVP